MLLIKIINLVIVKLGYLKLITLVILYF